MGNLQRRAAKLPGTTAEYAQMLGALTQPILDAKLSMQDLEDITVGAVVSAKALGVQSEVAARDIDQAIRGQFHANDVLTGKLLGSVGFKGETGRARFNALDARKRAEALKQAITQKQIVQLGAAQGETFSGVLSTLQDSIQQFFAKAGLPLFKAITRVLKDWVEWLGKNEAKVRAVADAIGKGLMAAFTIVGNIVNALIDLFKEMWADEDIRAVIEAILGLIRALVKFLMKSENVKAIVKGMFLPLIGILKIVGYLINNVGGWFDWLDQKLIALGGAIVGIAVAIKDFFVGIGTAIRDFFGAVIDWIAAKIDWVKGKVSWVWDKAKSIANFVGGGVNIPDLMKTVQGATPAVGGAGTASRVVPPSGFAPPPVNLQAPTTVKIMGNIPADWIETTVDQRIRSDKEKTWRDVHAATGGEEQ
jgi:hypothetical protein